jgi:hypothetical protein
MDAMMIERLFDKAQKWYDFGDSLLLDKGESPDSWESVTDECN